MSDMVIAIDGPSASGKGALARRIADVYGWSYFDSGLLYRAVAQYCLEGHIEPETVPPAEWPLIAQKISPLLDNADALREEHVGQMASRVAAISEVRTALLAFQRNLVTDLPPGVFLVMDGRDIGSVIFPQAALKIFLTASTETRALRRFHEMLQREDKDVLYETVLEDLKERDARDQQRSTSPLKQAEGAVVIDNSLLTIEETVSQVREVIDTFLYPSPFKFLGR